MNWLDLLGYAAGPARQRKPVAEPVTTRTITMKTLADVFNQGVDKSPSYEFSNHRRFTQPGDQEII